MYEIDPIQDIELGNIRPLALKALCALANELLIADGVMVKGFIRKTVEKKTGISATTVGKVLRSAIAHGFIRDVPGSKGLKIESDKPVSDLIKICEKGIRDYLEFGFKLNRYVWSFEFDEYIDHLLNPTQDQ